MLVTVIGSTGVLGRRVTRILVDQGHSVRALARSTSAAAALPTGTAIVGDVWDPGFVRLALTGADAALMLATSIPDGAAAALPRGWRENDRIRSELAPAVANLAREVGVSTLVQESHMYVYPESGDRWVDETTALDPARQARTCLDAELAARELQAADGTAKAVILRFGLFAASDSGLSKQAWQLAKRGRGLVLGDLDGYLSQVHVHDAAAAVVHALRPELPGGTYNVAAEPSTKAAWLQSLSGLAGRTVEPPPSAVRTALPRVSPILASLARSIRLDSSSLKAAGWEPRYPAVDAIWGAVGSGSD